MILALVTLLTYWIEPCTQAGTSCRSDDIELAQWALDAWQKASGGRLKLEPVAEESKARIRLYWAVGNRGLYGEARQIMVDGQRGAEVYVRPDLDQLGPEIAAVGKQDPLFRHTIVYLTCLHETGHALGLPHTARFEDIMYSFTNGGDIKEYFSRYRRRLASRSDIRKHSGMSAYDRDRLHATLDR